MPLTVGTGPGSPGTHPPPVNTVGAARPSIHPPGRAEASSRWIKTQLATGLAVTDLDTSGLGSLAFLSEVDTNEIANDGITTLKVAADAITEEKLKISTYHQQLIASSSETQNFRQNLENTVLVNCFNSPEGIFGKPL